MSNSHVIGHCHNPSGCISLLAAYWLASSLSAKSEEIHSKRVETNACLKEINRC